MVIVFKKVNGIKEIQTIKDKPCVFLTRLIAEQHFNFDKDIIIEEVEIKLQ